MEQERKINTKIECVSAGKIFHTPEGEHAVVRKLNFSTRENEFLVLFGPGQCGKTTIINMIAGFEDATAGEILAMGKKWKSRMSPGALCFSQSRCSPG